MSVRKLKAVEAPASGFTPTHWRCEQYPNFSLELPAIGKVAKFDGGSYIALTPDIDAELQKCRGRKPIRRWSGVAIYQCGLCPFCSTDEEEVEEHRRLSHGSNVIEEG